MRKTSIIAGERRAGEETSSQPPLLPGRENEKAERVSRKELKSPSLRSSSASPTASVEEEEEGRNFGGKVGGSLTRKEITNTDRRRRRGKEGKTPPAIAGDISSRGKRRGLHSAFLWDICWTFYDMWPRENGLLRVQ